jgi:hypothetical protein
VRDQLNLELIQVQLPVELLLALHMYLDLDLLLKLSKLAFPLRMVGLDPEGMLLVVVDKLLDLRLYMLQRVLKLVLVLMLV